MIQCEQFLYGMGVPNYQQKTSGVTRILSDKNKQIIIDSTKSIREHKEYFIWFNKENLIACIGVHPALDTYGRTGVWIHVILTPIMEHFKQCNPLHFYRRYFYVSPDHESLQPIQITDGR